MSGTALLLLGAVASGAHAQNTGIRRSGVELRPQLVRTPAWSFETRTGTFVHRRAWYDGGTSVGLRAGVAPLGQALAFGSVQWDGGGFGDTSGYTVVEGGVEWRILEYRGWVPRLLLAGGRLAESGGVQVDFVGPGLGVDWYASRSFFVGIEIQRLLPVAVRSNVRGSSTTADAAMTRLYLGGGVRFDW